MNYQLLDSGAEQKLEQFGDYIIARPCSAAIWKKQNPQKWEKAHAHFNRDKGWSGSLPNEWRVEVHGVKMKLAPTDFGHLGTFPEHGHLWDSLRPFCRGGSVLNLFAYSGGATLAFAQEGATVCHLDASNGMVDWARDNAKINHLEDRPIRWIVDDALKFLKREVKRGRFYDGILLDPPTFGRGAKGEVFQIEKDLLPLLELCRSLLSPHARFLTLSCHTPGITPLALSHLFRQIFPKAKIEAGELLLTGPNTLSIPSGTFAKVLL